jgi:hypothetical protein
MPFSTAKGESELYGLGRVGKWMLKEARDR